VHLHEEALPAPWERRPIVSDKTGIEWTDTTWNPVRGCSRVSAGCQHCYAERQAIRQIKSGYAGLIQRTSHGPAWTGQVRFMSELLDAPLRWTKPRRVFVNSMSDLFHERVLTEDLASVFAYMARAHWHTFQVLTKRPAQMQAMLTSEDFLDVYRSMEHAAQEDAEEILGRRAQFSVFDRRLQDLRARDYSLPLPNVWLGVSVEDQATANERIPLLLQTPAAVRFVSYEPALGPVDFARIAMRCGGTVVPALSGIALIIVGGESGPGARPCDVAWIRSTVEQCEAARVACFVKQLGHKPRGWCVNRLRNEQDSYEDGMCDFQEAHEGEAHCGDRCAWLRDRKGADPAEWPADLRVRDMPR
jgi:protein gp37